MFQILILSTFMLMLMLISQSLLIILEISDSFIQTYGFSILGTLYSTETN